MKKLLCLIFVGLMLTCMPVSAAEGPALTWEIHTAMKTAFWNTYAMTPLSPEMKQEIEENFLTSMGRNLDIGATEYYGTINGCELFLEMLPLADETYIELAGYTLYWPSLYNVFCYRNGEFLTIQDAYDQGWLAAEHIGTIAYLNECAISMRIEYYGEYDGCHIGFINGGPSDYAQAECTITIAGMDFWFPDSQPLMVYRDGQMVELQSAYDMGWLSDREVERLWNYYTNGIYEDNPHTGDGILMPVVLLMTSSTGLCVFCFRKKRV